MNAAVLTRLQADSALMALLSGGLYDGQTVGEISRVTTPAAFDANGELKPCGLLALSSEVAAGPLPTSSRLGVTLYWYQRAGADVIDAARLRAYALLHRQRLTPPSGGSWELRYADDVLRRFDEVLRASLIVSRYVVMVRR